MDLYAKSTLAPNAKPVFSTGIARHIHIPYRNTGLEAETNFLADTGISRTAGPPNFWPKTIPDNRSVFVGLVAAVALITIIATVFVIAPLFFMGSVAASASVAVETYNGRKRQ